jgi:hypothetical protein
MAHDHVITFERAISTAQNQHQEAIWQARSAFDAACLQAQAAWTSRVAAAKAALDEVKGQEQGDGYDPIKREFDEATSTSPDLEPAREQLGRDVEAADQALNQALAAAREKLATAPSERR